MAYLKRTKANKLKTRYLALSGQQTALPPSWEIGPEPQSAAGFPAGVVRNHFRKPPAVAGAAKCHCRRRMFCSQGIQISLPWADSRCSRLHLSTKPWSKGFCPGEALGWEAPPAWSAWVSSPSGDAFWSSNVILFSQIGNVTYLKAPR